MPNISTQQTAELEHLVSLVAAAIKDYPGNANQKAQVAECEHQIDQLVYELYGLTPEEIEIVEEK